MDILKLIGRKNGLLDKDISNHTNELDKLVLNHRFLVIGGAGSIGQAVVKEIFKRNPIALHVVDINENNMVELVRDIRSSLGYIKGDFRTFVIDCGGIEFEALIANEKSYDYVLNLSALKHVRSEKDPYTLMRLIRVNILNTLKTIELTKQAGTKKYFCVSTDKAANPVNMMGASKRIMEMFLMYESESIEISTARFANVAFSDGSLLYGFNQRVTKKQPIAAPNDVRRYFLTPQESGELCLMSCLLVKTEISLFPKLSEELHLTTFSEIAERYINTLGYKPYYCESEEEARDKCAQLIASKYWPCYFFKSDTSGEKDFEEFYTDDEVIDMKRFKNLGVIKNNMSFSKSKLDYFIKVISEISSNKIMEKMQIINLFNEMITDFNHIETGKYLDEKM